MKECLGKVFISLTIILMVFTILKIILYNTYLVFLLRISRELGIKNEFIV